MMPDMTKPTDTKKTEKTESKQTRSARINADISALIRAKNTLLWIVTREEVRVERAITEASAAANYETRFWDCATGMTDSQGKTVNMGGGGYSQQPGTDPTQALNFIRDTKTRAVYVLRDLHKWFDPIVLRSVRSLARQLQSTPRDEARAIVILTPSSEVPPELAGSATVIDYPIPDRAEIEQILADVVDSLPPNVRENALKDTTREQAIDAAVGLTAEEASNCYARSLVTLKRIDPAIVSSEKKRVIAREKVLTWHEPDPAGLDAIGGLDILKGWLMARKEAFSPKAREFGLPSPKGAMLVGIPGTGKSLTAKCIASAWQMPLLRLDMGALRSKWVGESEANIRKALQVAEAVSPCVLWLDEIEKAMGGATGPQGDGGVAADALGAILSWMQERTGSVFVVATANDVRMLPPELLRKGRFDEVFWVDLPTKSERAEIVKAALVQHKRSPEGIDLPKLAAATDQFTGAEIAAIVPDALFTAFADGARPITTADLLQAAKTVVPLAKTAAERIEQLRDWAKGRARPASTPEATKAAGTTRNLDLD